ncbi:MAG: hypothetical protein FWH11_02790 [Micrococcales bacterium]|nr:hypothetical protein [Micrococcales bacterium]
MNIRSIILSALPLNISGVEVVDPVVTLFGEDWSLNLMCPWKFEDAESSFSWESESVDRRARSLVGRKIEKLIAGAEAIDPVFCLSGAAYLSIYADTDIDPWTLVIPGSIITGKKAG